MSGFKKLVDYKNNIIHKMITNENLVKALINNDSNFLEQSLPEDFQLSSLIYSHIYPYKFIPEIETDPKSFVTMSFGNYRYTNNVFKVGSVYFYIICHKSLIKTDYGLRYDYMLEQIDNMFNQQSDVGSFNLILDSGGDLHVNSNYSGAQIAYKFVDFQ